MAHSTIKKWLLLIVLLFAFGEVYAATRVPELGLTIPVKWERVKDGDTLVAYVELRFAVRLKDIDAPEKRTPEGMISTEKMKEKAEGKDGYVHVPLVDLGKMFSHERVVANGWVDRTNLQDWAVENGYAVRELDIKKWVDTP